MTESEARRQVAAGASRAGGERAARRRRTTPLLAALEQPPPAGALPEVETSAPKAETPAPKAETPAPKAETPAPKAETPAPKAAPPHEPGTDEQPAPAPQVAAVAATASRARRPVTRARVRAAASRRTSGGERLVAVADAAQRVGEELVAQLGTGQSPAEGPSLEDRLASLLAFLRRRLTGDFDVDEFGFDAELTDTVLLNLFRPLYRRWFRVEVRGIENIPDTGGALVVANHSGAIALDALMTQVAVHDEHPRHRHLRLLGADLVFSTPILGELARKGGATLASNADAERLLASGELVAVWPEGFKGIGKPFSERYKLQRFGRGGFVSAALKTGTPIIPCAIVGAEETYPIIGDMPSVARLLGVPYAPITPTWPLLGLLGLIPLPSKWLIEFCAPVLFAETDAGTAAAEDPMTVFDLTDQVRQTIQQTLYSLLVQRRSVFF